MASPTLADYAQLRKDLEELTTKQLIAVRECKPTKRCRIDPAAVKFIKYHAGQIAATRPDLGRAELDWSWDQCVVQLKKIGLV